MQLNWLIAAAVLLVIMAIASFIAIYNHHNNRKPGKRPGRSFRVTDEEMTNDWREERSDGGLFPAGNKHRSK